MGQIGDQFDPSDPGNWPLAGLIKNIANGGRRLQSLAGGNRATVLSIRGDDNKAIAMTITLVNEVRADPRPTPPIQALIEWGSGGVRSEALVDFINGSLVTVFGSSVRVTAINNGVPGNPDDTVSGTIGAFIGYLPASERQAQLTVDGGATAGGGAFSPATVIPQFARNVAIIGSPVVGGADAARFFDAGGAVVADIGIFSGAFGFPIPNAARTLAVTSTVAKTILYVFKMSL